MKYMQWMIGMVMALVSVFSVSLAAQTNAASNDGANQPKPLRIILMISDGCGLNHITAANYYLGGKDIVPDVLKPFAEYFVSTYSTSGKGYDPEKAWADFGYLKENPTDSAAAATAMACGKKTKNASLAVGPDNKPMTTIAEEAESKGMATGVITTVPFSHATPAGFVAHSEDRNVYADIANEMLWGSTVDVIMGAGNPGYDESGKPTVPENDSEALYKQSKEAFDYVGGADTWKKLMNHTPGKDADGDGTPDAWECLQDRASFQQLAAGTIPAGAKRILGVAKAHSTTQVKRESVINDPKKEVPYQTPRTETVPTLTEMSLGSLSFLNQNPKGFFLMIEGGAIDWASHANGLARMIEEEADFLEAVASVTNWIEQHGGWDNTLLVVTADHETGYLLGPGSNPKWEPIVNNGKGNMPGAVWNKTSHTNSLVPCFVRGYGADRFTALEKKSDPVRGAYFDNTDIGKVMFALVDDKRS